MTIEVPKATKGDAAHAVVKAGLSAIPMIGGPAVELFQAVVQPPLERRREEWMQAVGEKLQELEESQGIDIAALGQNEEFVSAVMHATTIAMRTHETEKREALRNAVLNVAMKQSPEDTLAHMFMDWIDSLTGMHLQVLEAAANPPPQRSSFQREVSIGMDGPNGPQSDLDVLIWADLYARRLVETDKKPAFPKRVITPMGTKFLNFITQE